jgi:aspartate aminotransferase-like enzyme
MFSTGSLFFDFVSLTVHSRSYIVNTSTADTPLSEGSSSAGMEELAASTVTRRHGGFSALFGPAAPDAGVPRDLSLTHQGKLT